MVFAPERHRAAFSRAWLAAHALRARPGRPPRTGWPAGRRRRRRAAGGAERQAGLVGRRRPDLAAA